MAPMKTRPITPPHSVANCWMAVETEASGSGEAVTRSLSAGDGLRCSRGQSDMDAQAAERGLLEAQLALVQHDLLGDDRQPEARPRRRRRRAAGERLEQALAILGEDAGAVVLDAQVERAGLAAQADADVPARPPVQRGVVEEVVDEEPEAAAPAVDQGFVEVFGELELDAGMAAPGGVESAVDEVAELDVLARQALGRAAARERLEALEQVDDAVLLGRHVPDERRALGRRQVGVARERVEVRAQRGERRAQLVSGVRGEAAC